jgi:hypothetical protein
MLAALIFAALAVAHVEAMSAQPVPCSVGLEKFERQMAHSKSSSLEGPTASQNGGGLAPPPADIGLGRKR